MRAALSEYNGKRPPMRDDSDMSMGAPLAQSLAVYGGEDFTVVAGANLGDAMADAEEIEMDDVYALLSHRPKELLTLLPGSGAAPFQIAETSEGPDQPVLANRINNYCRSSTLM